MQRRRFLGATAAAGTVALAGCSNVQPDPTVTDANAQSGLFGPTEIDVTIENSGPAGQVKAVIETKSTDGTTLQQFTRTVEMDKGEKRQVTWTVDLKEEADSFEVTAEPAGFF